MGLFLKDPLKLAADWLMGVFSGWGMPELAAQILIGFLGVLVLISLLMILDIVLVWVERKVVSRFQSRIGPNRVGPFGLIQPFADIIKLLIKEDITPGGADKAVFNLAPILSMMSVLILWAVVPLAPNILSVDVDLNVGALYIVAAGAIGTLSIIMAGWSSNNKYSLLGAFREVAVMLSFEIPMLAVILIPTILSGSMGIVKIVAAQDIWFVFVAPLAALIFLIAAIAELGRAPFDMGEAESELVAGYNTEYSGMKFGMFYAGELLHAFTFGGFWSILFFGGYRFLAGIGQPLPCDCHSHVQILCRVLGHHVDPIHGPAHSHRPHADFQLEISDAAGFRAHHCDGVHECASFGRPGLALHHRHVLLECASSVGRFGDRAELQPQGTGKSRGREAGH